LNFRFRETLGNQSPRNMAAPGPVPAPARQPAPGPVPAPACYTQTCGYLDWYLDEAKSPVVRIYGTTQHGQKCCLHLHGARPYLYAQLSSSRADDLDLLQAQVRTSDNAFAVEQVCRVSDLTSAYGFHHTPSSLAKVTLSDPQRVRALADYLAGGKVRRNVFDAHVGFIPQFLADYNLAGMADIRFSKVLFRFPWPAAPSRPGGLCSETIPAAWRHPVNSDPQWRPKGGGKAVLHAERALTRANAASAALGVVSEDLWYKSLPGFARTASCELEVDADVGDIITSRSRPVPGSLADKNVKSVPSLIPWCVDVRALDRR
jgi:hypothetical protein